jgi:AbrB family looped-hinge helix DNA binding protein
MSKVKVSPKYQVVIPKDVRETMGIRAGEMFRVFQYGDRIEFIPVRKLKTLRGFLKGMDTRRKRERDRI